MCSPNKPYKVQTGPKEARAARAGEQKAKSIPIDRSYDIPYLAGYPKTLNKVFIDRHMPKSFVYDGKRVYTDRYLAIHECVEKTLIDECGLEYMRAHKIATDYECRQVLKDGVSWKAYCDFMNKHIKTCDHEKVTKVPSSLDLTPYVDEKDKAILKKIMGAKNE